MRQVDLRARPDRRWLTQLYLTLFHSEHIDEAVMVTSDHKEQESVILFRITGRSG